MNTTVDALIKRPDEITSAWLGAVLDAPDLVVDRVTRIGTGQMSQAHRVSYSAGGAPASVVVKLASDDETSRATGAGLGAYAREIAFYRHLAPLVAGSVPACHLAVYDQAEGWFTLVLADVEGAAQGDQIAGCSVEQAETAVRALARLHAPVLNEPSVGGADYLNVPNPIDQAFMAAVLPGFLERYGDAIDPEHAQVCRTFVAVADAWHADRRPPLGLVHGDYRLDNLLLTDDACTVVDWQTMGWGPAMVDLSYFLGTGLLVADRRAHEERLVRLYHDELLAAGIQNFAWETCWEEYRRQTFRGLWMAFVSPMVVVRTERGDAMFLAVFERVCRQVLDLDALDLLPRPGAPLVPLVPDAADEGLHEPGPEALWNESWYFDAVDESGDLGLYLRLGRLPNQDVAFYAASIVRPGRPTLMVVDHAAPLPAVDDPSATVTTPAITATQRCAEPLRRWRIALTATAQAYDDAAALLRGEAGAPTPIGLELTWETEGTPYQWRAATRYEIPCRVSGTVTIDGEEIAFTGPGQRDHSWGSRDWWSIEWMWNAFHLDDGTRTHATALPQIPGRAVGYEQRDGVVTEVEGGTSTYELGDDGLVATARITTEPGPSVVEVEPLAFGPLALTAPDGRVTHVQRAMARVRTGDGRTGLGWIEWNMVQPSGRG